MAEKYFGETIRIGNTFYDIEGVLYDPTTLSLAISDPEGTVIKTVTFAAGEIKKTSVGVFYYDYDIPATGVSGYWVASWEIEITAKCDISEIQFFVKDVAEKLYVSVAVVKSAILQATQIIMSDDDIRKAIRVGMNEVDMITGRVFTNANQHIEMFSTNQPNPAYLVNQLFLSYLPVQGVTLLEEIDTTKAVVKTWDASEYYFDSNGIIDLCVGTFGSQRNRVKVTYLSGYTAIPGKISDLCSVIAQIKMLMNYMISQDSEMTSFSILDTTVTLGEVYQTARLAIDMLERQKKILLVEIGNLKTDLFIC